MQVQTKDGQEFDPRSDEFDELNSKSYKLRQTGIQKLIKSLQIFDEAGITHLPGAEHDILYGPTPDRLTLDQVKQLYLLGWQYNSDVDIMSKFV